MKTKLIIVIAAVVIFSVAIAARQRADRPQQAAKAPVATVSPSATPASGNVNDIARELFQNSSAEAENFDMEVGDKTALGADTGEIGNLGQTYDENSL